MASNINNAANDSESEEDGEKPATADEEEERMSLGDFVGDFIAIASPHSFTPQIVFSAIT